MSITPRFLDEIRSRITLSDSIGKRIKVTRAGREFKACCPFHKEKTPSFTINDDKQFYHCFGCGAHGDVIGFTMRHDNLSFIDAVEKLAAEAGLQMPKPDPEAVKKAERARDLYSLMDEATKWMEDQFYAPENEAVLNYMLERGLKRETLEAFRVGYAPNDGQALRAYLKGQGYSDKDMIDVGVLKTSTRGKEPYAFFRERVMFPVADRRGRVVAFGGRILPDHMRAPDRGDFTPPKYINSSDTALFDKGRMLYGEALARQAAGDGHSVIVTEGYMDVIAAHQGGFRGAVAPMGTALTEEQILSLWKMFMDDEKVPVLCFDGDNAGRRAASRACERVLPLLKPGQSVRFAFLPDGEDPDTLIRKQGAKAFRNVLEGAMSLFDFIWYTHTAGRNFETPEARAGVVKTLEQNVAQITDGDVQRHYKALLRDKVSETFFPRRSYNKGGKTPSLKRPGLKIRKPAFTGDQLRARIFLATIVNHPYVFEEVEESLGRLEIADQRLDALRQTVISSLTMEPDLDRDRLKTHLYDAGFDEEIGDSLGESVYVHAGFASPKADSEEVLPQLQEWLREVEGRDWSEINAGWKEAYRSADQDEVEKIREMVRAKTVSES